MLNVEPPILITRLLTLVIAFTVHEFSHAYVATAFGDDTAQLNGRLTLNPLKHLDFLGSVLLLTVGFGWAKPVPINPTVLKEKSRFATMWVSVAGPLSNLFLAALAALPLRFGIVQPQNSGSIFPSMYLFLVNFILINLLLLVFNLIPLAPLDGEKVIEAFVPESMLDIFNTIRPYGSIILLVLVFVLPRIGIDVFGQFMFPIVQFIYQILLGVKI
jgi:Zn-dependent protease